MISFSKIAPPVIGIGIAAVYASSVAAVLFVVGGALISPDDFTGCSAYDVAEPASFSDRLRDLGEHGPDVCTALVYTVADRVDEGDYNIHYIYDISDCFDQANAKYSELELGELLVQEFPEQPDFYNLLAIAEMDSDNVPAAKRTLKQALQLPGLDAENASVLHNNYAWALLSSKELNFSDIDAHSDTALALNSLSCPLIHTRMTYEFARNINKPSGMRDMQAWIQVREVYNECLEMYLNPKYRQNGVFIDDSVSAEVFSTYVMDSLLLTSDIDVPIESASYLSPVSGTLNKEGVDQFCKTSMALRNEYVQGACKQVVKQVNQWARGSFYRGH